MYDDKIASELPKIIAPEKSILVLAYARVYDTIDKYSSRVPIVATIEADNTVKINFPLDYPANKKGTVWIEFLCKQY